MRAGRPHGDDRHFERCTPPPAHEQAARLHIPLDTAAIDGDQDRALDLMLLPFPDADISTPAAWVRPNRGRADANGEDLDGHRPSSLSEAARDTGVAIAAILLRTALDRRGHGALRAELVSPSGAAGYGSEPEANGVPSVDRRQGPAALGTHPAAEE